MSKGYSHFGSKIKNSFTNWESSFFGGYKKILMDHPEVWIDPNVDFDVTTTDKMDLYEYSCNKLIKLFLLKVTEFEAYDVLLANATVQEIQNKFTGRVSKYNVIAKQSIINTLSLIIHKETEIQKLFDHYASIISSLDLRIKIEDKSEKDGEKEGEGNEEDGDVMDGCTDGEASFGNNSLEESMAKLSKTIIKDGKFYNDFTHSTPLSSGVLKSRTKFKSVRKRNEATRYSADETLQANKLANMLDISFDPREDRIDNLKAGKLSIHKLAEMESGNTSVYHRYEENQTTKPFSVCILMDESGSMTYRIPQQVSLAKVLYKAFSESVPDDKIYVFGHTGESSPDIYIYQDKFNPDFEYTIDDQLSRNLFENYDGPVIESIYERVRQQTNDNIIFVLISDGAPSGMNYGGPKAWEEMKRIIEKCKRDGFVTVGVGLDFGAVAEIYPYHTVIHDYSKMVANVSTLINTVVKTEFQDDF